MPIEKLIGSYNICSIRQHWHPEFKQYDEERHRYVPKGYREPWQRKWGLGRRYSKNAPKVTVPLQDKVSSSPADWWLNQSLTLAENLNLYLEHHSGCKFDLQVSEFQMPDTRYNKTKPLTGYAWKNNKDQGPGFS